VTSARGVEVTADIGIGQLPQAGFDMLILPGGLRGVENLSKSEAVCKMLKDAFANEAPVAAICSAPALLADLGLLQKRRVTCYPTFADKIKKGGGKLKNTHCYTDKNLITGRGPGAAIDFGLNIVTFLKGKKITSLIAKDMCLQDSETIIPLIVSS